MTDVTIGTRLRCVEPNIYFKRGDELVIDNLNLLGYKDTHSGLFDEDGISYTVVKAGDKFMHCAYRHDWATFEVVDNNPPDKD